MNVACDPVKSEQFAKKMLDVMNYSGLALMTSIGHRLGLFDALAPMPPSTSAEITAAAGLNERYVREWLGAMVTGDIVEYSPATGKYRLPAEHAAWLTRAASPNNMAVSAQWVSVLGMVEDKVLEAFRHGRGVPYSAYHRFHEVMAEESRQSVVEGLLQFVLPLAPGLDRRLQSGIDVLDVGCGSGQALMLLAEHFPQSRFCGRDFSAEAVAAANAEASRRGLTNLRFEVGDAAKMEFDAAFDLVTAFDAIHDQARPAEVLSNIARALRPDGLFLMQDISGSGHVHTDKSHPVGPFLYTISCMHCMSVSRANDGPGLGAMWGKEKSLEMLNAAGFSQVRVETLEHDPMNFWYLAELRA